MKTPKCTRVRALKRGNTWFKLAAWEAVSHGVQIGLELCELPASATEGGQNNGKRGASFNQEAVLDLQPLQDQHLELARAHLIERRGRMMRSSESGIVQHSQPIRFEKYQSPYHTVLTMHGRITRAAFKVGEEFHFHHEVRHFCRLPRYLGTSSSSSSPSANRGL